MKMKQLFAATIGLLMLCGCGGSLADDTTLTEGEVYGKRFVEAHSETKLLPLIQTNGKITTTTIIPYNRYYPDTYEIYIRDYQDGEWLRAVYYVPEDVYNIVNVGDMFEYVVGRDLTERPYTQERQ